MRLKTIMLCVSLLLTSPSAFAAVDCKQVVGACDKVIKIEHSINRLQEKRVKKLTEQTLLLNTKLQQTQDSLGAWYRNPFVLIALGLVAGVAITR